MSVESIDIRKIRCSDSELLFNWANERSVRSMALNSEKISWEEHCKWFENKFNDPDCLLYLGLHPSRRPIGQIRFDCNSEGHAVVDVAIAPDFRNAGLGSQLIKLGTDLLFRETAMTSAWALIKRHNEPSRRAFEKAGYQLHSMETIKQQPCYRLVLARS